MGEGEPFSRGGEGVRGFRAFRGYPGGGGTARSLLPYCCPILTDTGVPRNTSGESATYTL